MSAGQFPRGKDKQNRRWGILAPVFVFKAAFQIKAVAVTLPFRARRVLRLDHS
jgi:hypothetical protein